MPLTPTSDVATARWVVEAANRSGSEWRVIELGPPGYEAYARILHPPEDGAADAEARPPVEGDLDPTLLTALCGVLSVHTETPEDCAFCLWEGYGDLHGGGALAVRFDGPRPVRWIRQRLHRRFGPRAEPALPRWFLDGPKVQLPLREYYLFTGRLADVGDWSAAVEAGWRSNQINSPNLSWPADRAWFVATEIDSAWTGVAGDRELIDALLADERFDAVETRWDDEQPSTG